MHIPQAWVHRWRRVDHDPAAFISYLDASRAANRALADKDPVAYYTFLELEPGHHVLDVGCGTGDMLRRIAPIVGPTGRVVGVDASAGMVDEARRRVAAASLPVELVHCSATQLDLPSGAFDRVTTGAVLQHLDDPGLAIREMARVTRSGGRVLATEQDWDTLVIDAEPLDLARRMCRCFSDALPNGTIGRRAAPLFAQAGLTDVRVTPLTQVVRTISEGDAIDRAFAVELAREAALPAGIIDEREAAAWREELLARGREGRFFMSFTAFEIVGTKP